MIIRSLMFDFALPTFKKVIGDFEIDIPSVITG